PPDRPRFITELTRVIYNVPEGRNSTTDALLKRLAAHLEIVSKFQVALAALQLKDRDIALAMATQKNERNRLKDFLDLIGLKLREKNKTFSVERSDNKQAGERLKLLADLGIDLNQLSARLNRGEAVRVEVPVETVPVPLTTALWGQAVFQRPVVADTLFAAIIGDRAAALLCHGLAALDDQTLQYLADHPAILSRIYEHDAPVFAV